MLRAVLGLAAGSLTTLAWLPQLHHTWHRRSAGDISWPYLASMSVGITAWLGYGVLRGDGPLVATNGLTLVFVLWLTALKGLRRSTGVVSDPDPATEHSGPG